MCGITGFYSLDLSKSRAELHVLCQKMTSAIVHRGPDGGDIWQDPDHKIVFGHRRLSIIDLSPLGAQPMSSHSGRYVITYNGEFYNYPALQRELEALGIVFKGRSDTEIFLAAIEQWGLNRALQKVNGMFAFALWDRQLKQLHFARDRLGKKPLYIGWAGKSLIFGSELKALRAYPEFKPEINQAALAEYLQRGWLNAPHCIYKNVWMLKPAHRITLDIENQMPGAPLDQVMEPYWHPLEIAGRRRSGAHTKSEKQILDEFETLLENCVSDRMVSDVPLGAFLSGGIDSSAIVALMQKSTNRPVKTYTIGFHESGFDEAVHAKKIAAHLGTDHHEHYLGAEQALEIIPRLPDMFDEPFADMSAIPTYLVSHFARRDVTVALSGDGGDEMLGGYARHLRGPQLARRMAMIPQGLRLPLAKAIQKIPTHIWDRLHPKHPQFGKRIHKASKIFLFEKQSDIYTQLLNVIDTPPILFPFKNDELPDLPDNLDFAERMMLWDTLGYLPGDVLTKVDRASMACSLEARAPLLDPRIYEYAWSLPLNYKIRNGQGKWLLRQILARHVPRTLFERPKQGFSIPIGEWLRGPLNDWAETLLSEAALSDDGLLNVSAVRSLWTAHKAGRGNHTQALWTILMFQSWKHRWM
jgi:asparagine synthase (glutamine-hydrolysing)